jgi:hypothetical protein
MSERRICKCGRALQPGRGVEWIHVITRSEECPDYSGGSAQPIGGEE